MRSSTNAGRPIPVRHALTKLGHDIREARIRRRITAETLAQRASISRTTLSKLEKGHPGIAIGNLAAVLFALGLLDQLTQLADVRNDPTGLALEGERLPKRVRKTGGW